MKKIQFGGSLPFFTGFYNTIYDQSERWSDYLEDRDEGDTQEDAQEFDPFDRIDYCASLDNAARAIFDAFKENEDAQKFLEEFDLEFTFDKLYSPTYYNCSNDEIFTNNTIAEKGIVKLFDYLSNNFEKTLDTRELCTGLLEIDEYLNSKSIFDHAKGARFLTSAIEMVFDKYLTDDQKEGLMYDLLEASESIENIVFLDEVGL